MNIVLERFCYGADGLPTLGRLTLGTHRLFSLEQPWRNNKPFASCVPDGLYRLVPHSSEKHPDTWALVNPDLDIYHLPSDIPEAKQGKARFACLIHVGNYQEDVEGCIAPGVAFSMAGGRPMVTRSTEAMDTIRRYLGPGEHSLLILPTSANLFE